MLLLWLVVLPAEFIEISLRQQSISTGFWGWSIKLLYFWGYTIALFSLGPLDYYSSAPDQVLEIFIVFFGLIITSPVYFTVGALLAARKESMMTLGVVLAVIHLVVSCLAAIWLLRFMFSA